MLPIEIHIVRCLFVAKLFCAMRDRVTLFQMIKLLSRISEVLSEILGLKTDNSQIHH
jgi:hypothetical protein